MHLKKLLFASSSWTLVGTAGQQILSFFIFVYLARLLPIEAFGLLALAAAFTDIVEIVVRWGQTNALLQYRNLDDRIQSTSFWIIVAISLIAFLLMVLVSWPAAQFFHAPSLTWVFASMAALPGLAALGSVHEALIRRSLKFRSLALRNVTATLISGGIAIYFAYRGVGVLALIAQRLSFATLSTIFMVAAYPWFPRFTFSRAEARELIAHGGRIMWNGLSIRVTPRVLDLLVGYFLGTRMLGLLRISIRFFDFLVQGILFPLSDVLPAVLRHAAHDMSAIRRIFRRLIALASTIFFPVTLGVGVLAEEITKLLFGPRWIESVPLIQCLSLLAFTLPISTFFAPVMITLGHSRYLARTGLWRILAVTILTLITAQISLLWVAIGYVTSLYVVTLLSGKIIAENINIPQGEIIAAQVPAFVATFCMSIVVLIAKSAHLFAAVTNAKLQFGLYVLCGATAYALTLLLGTYTKLWPHYAEEILATLPSFLSRMKSKKI